jgi:GNAT superfamily N-acetyltransferase
MTDWALELAENANAHTPLGPRDARLVTDRFVLWMGRGETWNVAQRFRMQTDDVDVVRAEIHAALRARDRSSCTWEVGSHATPADLVDRLLELGLVDDDPPLQVGMVLEQPPAQSPALDVEVRRVTTTEEYLEAERIARIAFHETVAPPDEDYVYEPSEGSVIYLAYVDGEPAARGSAAYSEHGVTLFGGATLPEARGRGAYRALVAARWQDAVARGRPLLVTQASPMSRPILARLGFREVCEIRALVDRF